MEPNEILRELKTAATLAELGDESDRAAAATLRERLLSLDKETTDGFLSLFEGLSTENFTDAWRNIVNGSRSFINEAVYPALRESDTTNPRLSFSDLTKERPKPIDSARNLIDPSDPIQQIDASAEETVVNNAPEANAGAVAAIESLGPLRVPAATPTEQPPVSETPPGAGGENPLLPAREVLPANPFDALLAQENAAAATEAERLRLRDLDEQSALDALTSNISGANAQFAGLLEGELTNTLALDEYNRRVAQAGLIGTAQTQSSQQVINRLAGLPGLGGDISAIAPALAQANPAVTVPDITPGIAAQARATNSNFRQNDAASAGLRTQLLDRVKLQSSLRADLQSVIASRLRGE